MKRHKHNLSHYKLLTTDGGWLTPVSHYEVIPGDTINHQSSVLLRASPLLAPVMHRFHVRLHSFYVPFRLLSDQWEDFITGNDPAAQLPKVELGNISIGDLADHLGIQPADYSTTTVADERTVNAWPFLAYHRIFNEFYRDQDLVQEHPEDVTDPSIFDMHRIAWGKDYFTSARPWAQKGQSVTIPLGTTAPVIPNAASAFPTFKATNTVGGESTGTRLRSDTQGQFQFPIHAYNDGNTGITEADTTLRWDSPNLMADLSGATASDVRDLRVAFALQRYEEARAMYGSRYTEYLRYLGVTPSDARLQRPEYLGGGKRDISFSEVLQTAEGNEPVGTMRGHGISGLSTRPFRKFFEEHGIVMTLMSVRPQSIYTNGVHRSWWRQTKEDYYQQELQLIGQQEIFNGEVYAWNDDKNREVFGYQDRYSEYTHHPSSISGDFRNTLNFWHAAREFTARPALNQTFIECNPASRIFAVPTEDTFWCVAQQKVAVRRAVMSNPKARII